MFDELQIYLSRTVSPEHAHILLQACKVLEDSGIRSVGDYLEEFMATLNTRSTDETLSQLHDLLINQYEIALNQFGIFLVEGELKLKTLTGLLKGVLDIENYDNPLAVLDVCQSDADPEEKFIELMQLTTSLVWDDLLNQIEGVNNNLIERIVESLPEIEENDTVPETEQFILNRTKALIKVYPTLWVMEEVDNGFLIGQAFDLYFTKFVEYYEEQEIKTPIDQIAKEYLGFVLLSNVSNQDIKQVALERLEDIFTDAVILSKVSLKVESLLDTVLTD